MRLSQIAAKLVQKSNRSQESCSVLWWQDLKELSSGGLTSSINVVLNRPFWITCHATTSSPPLWNYNTNVIIRQTLERCVCQLELLARDGSPTSTTLCPQSQNRRTAHRSRRPCTPTKGTSLGKEGCLFAYVHSLDCSTPPQGDKNPGLITHLHITQTLLRFFPPQVPDSRLDAPEFYTSIHSQSWKKSMLITVIPSRILYDCS